MSGYIRLPDLGLTVRAAAADTGGRLSLIESAGQTPGTGPRRHVHTREDEAFYVLDGRIAGYCGDQAWIGTSGSFIWLPRDVPHGFKVEGEDDARILQLSVPSGFDEFVRQAGTPATAPRIPDPGPPDIERLDAAAQRTGQTILGPPRA